MANPGELLRCAAENKRRRPAQPRPAGEACISPEQNNDNQLQLIRRPVGGHSAYSALMRSHDRVHPRIGR